MPAEVYTTVTVVYTSATVAEVYKSLYFGMNAIACTCGICTNSEKNFEYGCCKILRFSIQVVQCDANNVVIW